MKSTTNLLPLFLLAITAAASASEEKEDVARIVSTGTESVPVEQVAPKYPSAALHSHIEGWVIVGFRVNEHGETENVVVLDQNIEKYFEKAAINAIKKWKYKPATLNDRPVAQEKNTARITFTIEDLDPGVSRRFAADYKKAMTAIINGDLEEAAEQLEKLEQRATRLLSEVAYLDYVKGIFWQKNGDKEKSLHHYDRALVIPEYVPVEIHINLLRFAMSLDLEFRRYMSFLDRYEELLETDADLSESDDIHRVAEQVERMLESETPFTVSGEITAPCNTCEIIVPFWSHRLARNSFSIKDVNGEISGVNLRCGFNFVSLAYEPLTVWTANRDWGDCNVEVLGSVGTTFELVEVRQ